jgi:hypothetical protein
MKFYFVQIYFVILGAFACLANAALVLSWTDTSTNQSGYGIQRSTNQTTWTEIATVSAPTETYSDTNVSPARTYSYQVWSYNSAGNSPLSNVTTFTTPHQTNLVINFLWETNLSAGISQLVYSITNPVTAQGFLKAVETNIIQ